MCLSVAESLCRYFHCLCLNLSGSIYLLLCRSMCLSVCIDHNYRFWPVSACVSISLYLCLAIEVLSACLYFYFYACVGLSVLPCPFLGVFVCLSTCFQLVYLSWSVVGEKVRMFRQLIASTEKLSCCCCCCCCRRIFPSAEYIAAGRQVASASSFGFESCSRQAKRDGWREERWEGLGRKDRWYNLFFPKRRLLSAANDLLKLWSAPRPD